jgi:hypothetical protein
MFVPGWNRPPRLGTVLWLTALLLAAVHVPSLNAPEPAAASAPGMSANP